MMAVSYNSHYSIMIDFTESFGSGLSAYLNSMSIVAGDLWILTQLRILHDSEYLRATDQPYWVFCK
jgi:hypothetical protein